MDAAASHQPVTRRSCASPPERRRASRRVPVEIQRRCRREHNATPPARSLHNVSQNATFFQEIKERELMRDKCAVTARGGHYLRRRLDCDPSAASLLSVKGGPAGIPEAGVSPSNLRSHDEDGDEDIKLQQGRGHSHSERERGEREGGGPQAASLEITFRIKIHEVASRRRHAQSR